MGNAFAPLNRADHDRIESYSDAIQLGVRQAREQRDFESEMAGDDDFLRSMGFGGRSAD